MLSHTLLIGEFVGRHTSKMHPEMDWGQKGVRGYSAAFLRQLHARLGEDTTTLYELSKSCDHPSTPDAVVLVIHTPNELADRVLEEVSKMPFAQTHVQYGKVCNSTNRRLCYIGAFAQDADSETGQQPVRTWEQLPACKEVRDRLHSTLDDTECMVGCVLQYPDILKGGIGWHGDAERCKSLVMRLGHVLHPLWFRFFQNSDAVSTAIPVALTHGDIAIACQVAVGTNYKMRSRVTVRHATGFLKDPVPVLKREKEKKTKKTKTTTTTTTVAKTITKKTTPTK